MVTSEPEVVLVLVPILVATPYDGLGSIVTSQPILLLPFPLVTPYDGLDSI